MPKTHPRIRWSIGSGSLTWFAPADRRLMPRADACPGTACRFLQARERGHNRAVAAEAGEVRPRQHPRRTTSTRSLLSPREPRSAKGQECRLVLFSEELQAVLTAYLRQERRQAI
jgi:hypothetical protein